MEILLPAIAVAFTAFCVWLAVRFINRRERWAKWTLAAMISLPWLYVLSIGPAIGIASAINAPWTDDLYDFIYWPLLRACAASKEINFILMRYGRFWVR
jgi:hypothetical protein